MLHCLLEQNRDLSHLFVVIVFNLNNCKFNFLTEFGRQLGGLVNLHVTCLHHEGLTT